MYTHRFASTQYRCMPHRLIMALTVTLALGVLPLAQAGQLASAAAPKTGSDKAAQHGIIFVGGHKQGDSRHVRAHPPGHCGPQKGSHSAGDDCSLNPQPIPPGRNDRTTDKSLTHAPKEPRMHKPAWRHGPHKRP